MAFTVSDENKTLCGNFVLYTAKIKGDGSDTTLYVPLKKVVAVWTGNIDDTSAIPAISASANLLTYAAAPTSTKYHWVCALGTP